MDTRDDYKKRALSAERSEILRKNTIKCELINLNQCKGLIVQLKKEDTSSMTKLELHHHERRLDLQTRRKKAILEKLLKIGYKADRRGRPTKNERDKYKSVHTRIACYFTEDNAKLLRGLKEQGSIKNISDFLNELLESYFALSKDGDTYEKEN